MDTARRGTRSTGRGAPAGAGRGPSIPALPVTLLAVSALALAACGHSAPRAASRPSVHSSTTTTTSTVQPGSGCLRSTPPEAPSATAPAAAAVEFVSPTTGWVAGAGRILVTLDGGQHWSTQLTGSFVAGSVDFLNRRDGFVVTQGALLGTTDGGSCWRELAEPSAGPLRGVHFVSPQRGWGIAGGSSRPPRAPASTTTTEPNRRSPRPSVAPRPPWTGGTLVQTTNGGRSWTTVPTAPGNAQSVCFVDAEQGWLGADGKVYASENGGSTWQEVADPTSASGYPHAPADLEVLDCGAPSAVWVVSSTGATTLGNSPWAVFASSDGTTFHLVAQDQYTATFTPSLITPGSFPGVASVVSADAAAVTGYTPNREPGSQTAVQVMKADGSEIEGTHVVPEMGRPTGLAFLSHRVGWIVGTDASSTSDAGLIEHTTDGGSTWTVQTEVP